MGIKKGQNQTFARNTNLALIMDEFEKRSMSRSEMAKIFNLSKPATSKITAELELLKLIRPCRNEVLHVQPGVKPVNYEINSDYGIIAIIDLSTVEAKISICDFSGAIISSMSLPDMETIKYGDFVNLRKYLKDMLASDKLKNKKLLSLCVAVPCAINKTTSTIIWSPRFNIDTNFNLFEFLKEEFKTKIIIKNDVHLYLVAEKAKGCITSDVRYALFVYADAGLGGGFYLNSRIEDGENGTAGDIGFYNVADEGGVLPLDSAVSINALKRKLKKSIENGAKTCLPSSNLRFKDITAAYENCDELTVKTVEHSAEIFADAIINFIDIFNTNFIVIGGRISHFGQRYIQIIKNRVATNHPNTAINYSTLKFAVQEGAFDASVKEIIADAIRNRKNII